MWHIDLQIWLDLKFYISLYIYIYIVGYGYTADGNGTFYISLMQNKEFTIRASTISKMLICD